MEKYRCLDNLDIVQELSSAIIIRAVLDYNSKDTYTKEDADRFLRSEWCELLCGITNASYSLVLCSVYNATKTRKRTLGRRKNINIGKLPLKNKLVRMAINEF